ncbi:MAG: DUF177 domain-containing protein [Uliginosibacterium sp.]|jgi:uncharacterized protein|nr:DUF177 domain-containing protein [Uliginosibacterium sp.]
MSHQPEVIPDPFEFARRGSSLGGELDACSLPRLAESLCDVGAEQGVRYTLSGFVRDDKFFLDVKASANLTMQCQRCLGNVSCLVEADSRLLLVPRNEELPDEGLEEDDFDPIHAGHDLDVSGTIEEELLLALPLAPTHENCSMPAAQENGDERSPFAALKGLKPRG